MTEGAFEALEAEVADARRERDGIVAARRETEVILPPFGSRVAVTVTLDAEIVRQPRRACQVCRERRVLYRIRVGTEGWAAGWSEARCAPCWGI